MVAEALRLGPFKGGLNNATDKTTIEDDELIECLNFEVDIDGALVNRPAIQVFDEGTTDDHMFIFGSVNFSGTTYIFGSQNGRTYVSDDGGTSWDELTPDFTHHDCRTMAVYQNRVWMPSMPGTGGSSISWSPEEGTRAEMNMPQGSACVVHKNRLYIVPGETATTNSSRLYFSAPADFTDWPSTNFIDVQGGDGTSLNNLIVYQDNLLLFKSESTHVLAYDLDPADALLRPVNSVVGSHGSHGVVQHENTVYCLHHSNVYAIVNFNFELLNIKARFTLDEALPAGTSERHQSQSLSLLGDRLVVRFFNRTYVLGLRTGTWSEWRKTDTSSDVEWHIFGPLVRIFSTHTASEDVYLTTYSFTMNDGSGWKLLRLYDGHTPTYLEGYGNNKYDCVLTTKDYDMADPLRFKKLFWWGADLLSGNDIIGDTTPITLVFDPTFEDIGNLTLAELGTWEDPIDQLQGTITVIPGDGFFNTSKMVKFKKALRFRKVNFSLALNTNGSASEPAKVFSVIAVVKTKQVTSKAAT